MNDSGSVKVDNMGADLVVIGGGGAGLAAAAAAAEEGAGKVIVLEKRNVIGGNTAMSMGPFGVDSPVQKRMGIEFRKDELFKTIMSWTHWKANPRIVRAFIDKSGDTIRWMEEKGIEFSCMPLDPNQDPLTWHAPKGWNAEVIKVLADQSKKMGVKILASTPARKILIGKDGAVSGVVAERGGEEFTISTGKVISTTGGYGGNKELLKKYCPQYRDNMKCDGLWHTGDGLLMAMDIGANTEGLGLLLMSGPQIPGKVALVIDHEPEPMKIALMSVALEPDTLWVNKRGERFIDEGASYHHFECSNAVNLQPDNLCYLLMDSDLMRHKEEKGLLAGLGHNVAEERTKMPGLERELRKLTQGLIYVQQSDPDNCNGCGECLTVCAVGAISLDTSPNGGKEFSPCRFACPANVDMRRYMYLLKQGNIDEAYQILRDFLPLPAVTGRVCPHLCETDCARDDVDEAVNINSLERFVADYGVGKKVAPVPRQYDDKIAVVGSGPAGLACAYFLTRMGYPVTVFEAMPVLGGMLRMGIPEYRLPRDILDEQINYIQDMGVDFRIGATVGKDITLEQLQKDYQAVFFATGNQLSRSIALEGGGQEGVFWGLDFLRKVNLKNTVRIKDRVVVIGGGNVALDVALTVLRLGAREVQLACLETGDEIPAYKEEIKQALDEGVTINEGWGPQRVIGNGKVTGIELVRCTSVFDGKGTFNPTYDNKTTRILDADMIILATGQAPDHSLTPAGMKISAGGTVRVDPVTLETSMRGVFAGGDIVTGAASVVQAIADGNTASVSIDRYLRGEDLKKDRTVKPRKVQNPPGEGMPKTARMQTPMVSVDKVAGNFSEVKPGFDEDMVNTEAQRCMTCGSRSIITIVDECRLCSSCQNNCPVHAISPMPDKKGDPHVKISNTLSGIAKWMGADPKVLKATVDEYNRACDQGYDPIFAKDRQFLVPLRTPPFYAIRSNSDFLDTIGGLKINHRMEVLDKEDMPIPGLYAAGVVAGGWQHDTYCDTLSGAMTGFAFNSGRIAGENAAKFRKTKQSK